MKRKAYKIITQKKLKLERKGYYVQWYHSIDCLCGISPEGTVKDFGLAGVLLYYKKSDA